jgi:hypothetical protein
MTVENYTPDEFCLDYSIDYCDGTPTTQLRAIINDAGLKGVTTMFGAATDDTAGSKLLKQGPFLFRVHL